VIVDDSILALMGGVEVSICSVIDAVFWVGVFSLHAELYINAKMIKSFIS